ncbi:unnamed protein product [Effrenium voratum]|uniref:Uncharacterized protein n=1 Tax=Effrenium voratum TaxID=2562239 RepID=A0AA36N2T4_9DINO|nr:unnamed protein product [Effrenium voratum]
MAGGARADADPEAEALKAKGNEKLKAGDVKGALAMYQQALTRLPEKVATDSPAANLGSSLALNAALAALQLEDWEAAEGFCSRALRWKSSAKAFYRRGLARVHLGFMADAKRDFNFALESEPRGSAAARQVQLELDKLAHRDGAAGLEAPPGADPQAAKRFEIANAAKQQQGVRQITWSEWSSTQQRVAEATVKAKAWRKRLAEAAKCPVPESGGSTQLSQLLERFWLRSRQ